MQRQQRRPNSAVEGLCYIAGPLMPTPDARAGQRLLNTRGTSLIEPSLDMVFFPVFSSDAWACRSTTLMPPKQLLFAVSLDWHSVSWCSRVPLQELDCCWSASRLLHSSGTVQLLSITLHSAVQTRANLDCHQHAALLNQTRTSI